VALQEDVWGEGFSELAPVSLLKVAGRLGGVVAGAWDERGLAGFVFGVTGIEDGRPVHWSDMLAVRGDLRDAGLGARLKAWQRDALLARGIDTCYWTFDPLESRNAWLNLGKLGAVCREYEADMYGESDSPLHRGIGTDRFVALWLLDTPRVAARLAGREAPPGPEDVRGLPRAFEVLEGEVPLPGTALNAREMERAGRFLVPVPGDVQRIKARAPDAAAAWRAATREVLARTVGRGWQVVELVRAGDVSCYLVERQAEATA